MADTATGTTGRGSVSGTLTGTAIRFSMEIQTGGFGSPYDSCSANGAGDAEFSDSSIAGTYSGTNSCTGVIAAGQVTLTKSQ